MVGRSRMINQRLQSVGKDSIRPIKPSDAICNTRYIL